MSLIANFTYAALGCLVTVLIIQLLLRLNISQALLDKPNHRSMHTVPTPRIGGLVFVPVSASLCLLSQFDSLSNLVLIAPFAIALLIVYLLGAVDDRFSLTATRRLILQFVSATLCWLGIVLALKNLGMSGPSSSAFNVGSYLAGLVAIFLIVWSINLVNFMDGANGLVALVCVVGLCCLSLLIPNKKMQIAVSALVGCLLAFLYFNVVVRKIFMGDAGSTSLGLVIGALSVWGVSAQYWHWTIAVAPFAPLVFDASLTLLWRIYRRERFWEAHRSHLYQRLISEGHFSHLRVSIWYSTAGALGFAVLCGTLSSSILMSHTVAALEGVTYICIYYISNRWISAKTQVFGR
jgi:UDP-N-acetylmuramyl pentapeptide phosphotransferase/UDP-N-acetylglucosamine-1-phosphate transferase